MHPRLSERLVTDGDLAIGPGLGLLDPLVPKLDSSAGFRGGRANGMETSIPPQGSFPKMTAPPGACQRGAGGLNAHPELPARPSCMPSRSERRGLWGTWTRNSVTGPEPPWGHIRCACLVLVGLRRRPPELFDHPSLCAH